MPGPGYTRKLLESTDPQPRLGDLGKWQIVAAVTLSTDGGPPRLWVGANFAWWEG